MQTISKADIKRYMPSLNGHHYYIETVKRSKEYILHLYGAYNIEYLLSKADLTALDIKNGAYRYTIKPKCYEQAI